MGCRFGARPRFHCMLPLFYGGEYTRSWSSMVVKNFEMLGDGKASCLFRYLSMYSFDISLELYTYCFDPIYEIAQLE